MTEFSTILQQGNAWLFIPSAIFLGALHGLEPGHSKTMMAAFIVAIRGTLTQAILLGLSATLSHTIVVWVVAMAGLYFGQNWSAERTEPYLQLASAVIIIAVAVWMVWRTWHHQRHGHHHDHEHTHDDDLKQIDTGHGIVMLEVFEEGVPPRFRLHCQDTRSHQWPAAQIRLETIRPDGSRQGFTFVDRGTFAESVQTIPEPHAFQARLSLGDAHHCHEFDVAFTEHEHHHEHTTNPDSLVLSDGEYQDAHERAHADDIRRRFAGRTVTTPQIILFGLTGGLIPCPASITVLLLCLQLKKIALGATLVLSFSVGLAMTMVASGALAALSVKHVSKRWSGFGDFARKAPYLSGVLIILVGLYVGYQGLHALM